MGPGQAWGLAASKTSCGHSCDAAQPVVTLAQADAYAETWARDGAVIASVEARRAEIARQLAAAAAKVGGGVRPIDDDALLDEGTVLVEPPTVLLCQV